MTEFREAGKSMIPTRTDTALFQKALKVKYTLTTVFHNP
jgi:hypothetical protein